MIEREKERERRGDTDAEKRDSKRMKTKEEEEKRIIIPAIATPKKVRHAKSQSRRVQVNDATHKLSRSKQSSSCDAHIQDTEKVVRRRSSRVKGKF